MTNAREAYGPYGVVVREAATAVPVAMRFAETVDAVVTALDYLHRGYWVRLTDPTVRALDEDPDPDFLAALRRKLAGGERT